MRLIDADELITILDEELQKDGSLSKALLVGFAKQILNDAPTVEAEPVRRGKWKIGELEIIGDDIYGGEFELQHEICSVCGHDNMAWSSNYCPNCGAKMDEVTE